MKKQTKCIVTAAVATVAGICAYNKFVESTSTRKNLLSEENGLFYEWKHGNVFYTKTGLGKPVLLIHDLNSASSSEEWSKITKRLAKTNTVYALDLLGCGRSDKPAIQYTNYLYVQLITSFIKDIIKDETTVIASNLSASFIIMSNLLDEDLYDKIILINPVSIKDMEEIPDQIGRAKQKIINLPIIGTFIYNRLMTPIKIDFRFRTKYFLQSGLISNKLEDTYYESAHIGNSNGKYLLSSILSKFVNINIKNAVKKVDTPLYIIGSRNLKGNIDTMDNYHKLNPNIEITHISHGNLYPQLESPEKIATVIKQILE